MRNDLCTFVQIVVVVLGFRWIYYYFNIYNIKYTIRMADIQVLIYLRSTKDRSKSKTMSSSTPKNCLPKRLLQVSDTTNKLDSTSKHQSRQLNQTTSIKNVPSPLESPFEAKFLRESSSQPRCNAPLLSEEITCITCQNTTDTKRDIEISQLTFPLLFQ